MYAAPGQNELTLLLTWFNLEEDIDKWLYP